MRNPSPGCSLQRTRPSPRPRACLAAGGLVAFPTETVYGLGADATNGAAVARLYAAKGRPSFNPLIAHVADLAGRAGAGRCSTTAPSGSPRAFWPGPLTLVLPKRAGCPVAELATAGLDSIAVRVPDHPVARALLRAFGRPVVAPSANRSGHVSPTTAAHVLADLRGRIDLILDGGPTPGRRRIHHRRLPRPPDAAAARRHCRATTIERVLGAPLEDARASATPTRRSRPACWRRTTRRAARLRLERARRCAPAKRCWRSARHLLPGAEQAVRVLNLSPAGDPVEAASQPVLPPADARCAPMRHAIAVMSVPDEGLGEAINDRLARAAAPKG